MKLLLVLLVPTWRTARARRAHLGEAPLAAALACRLHFKKRGKAGGCGRDGGVGPC